MASFSERGITKGVNSENAIKEIQAERIIYQTNSSVETKKTVGKMRKDLEAVSKAMENARRIAYEKRLRSDELKIELSEKRDKVKKINQDLERARVHVTLAAKKASEFESETSKVESAIQKIKEATRELDSKYTERAQNELMNELVKLKYDTKKAQSDLGAAKEMEVFAAKKLQDAEMDFSKTEVRMLDRLNETDRIVANVANAITHIVKSYDEITTVSKDLLKSATSTRESEKFNYEFEDSEDQARNSELVA